MEAGKYLRGTPKTADGDTDALGAAHHRGIAQALRRHGPPAGRARLHRTALEGLLILLAFLPLKGGGRERSERGVGSGRRRLGKARGRGHPTNLLLLGGG